MGTLKIHMVAYILGDFGGSLLMYICCDPQSLNLSYIWNDFEGPNKCTFMGTLKVYMFSHILVWF